MILGISHIKEGLRFAKRALKPGFRKYKGNAEEICRQIVRDCWNGSYFQVSAGHFTGFYMRDFGWCAESLLKLGYKDKVRKTLANVLMIYKGQGRLTTMITPEKKAVDVFAISPDTIAYLFRSLRLAKARELVREHEDFLAEQVNYYFSKCFDTERGMIKTGVSLSSMKDHLRRESSTYNNCMIAMLSTDIDYFKMPNPFREFDIKKNIKENLWNDEGGFFYDDLRRLNYVAGDANVFPFFCGVFDSKKILRRCIGVIRREGLDKPFPLKYTKFRLKKYEIAPVKWLTPNYEGTSIWSHMAMPYIKLVKKIDLDLYKKYKEAYSKIIEKHGNYLEVFEPNGRPYKRLLYKTDESMLWAANYLTL
ncbi:hypothetical protein D6745_03375 [Candidatus Woesearchaeota archaeon]|nr:MAG: hypothetical protein D6745_03375 [Candidatus Woesearchaeota archaeon]